METAFVDALKAIATSPAARGLADDAARFGDLVITHDVLVEGVHFLATDPAGDVAWKLVSVNLSDLAAKGARPQAILMGAALNRDMAWHAAFVAGLAGAVLHFDVALIGGDTVAMPENAPIVLGLTAIGVAGSHVPSRAGAKPGDDVYVVGVIGDAGLGLQLARSGRPEESPLLDAYRRPTPLIETGGILASYATAMMDVSDGLLIDAGRIALASGVGIEIDVDSLPLSTLAKSVAGDDRDARLRAATAGDDYALLLTASKPLPQVADRVTRIGRVTEHDGLTLKDRDGFIPLPARLGWLHD
jgi:thiamine-monophosphate kinase